MNNLLIVSGRSGSGKSSALNILEDLGYYCIDNLPLSLLPSLIVHLKSTSSIQKVGVGVDVRSLPDDFNNFHQVISDIEKLGIQTNTLFLDARDDILIARFSSTRRRHPLSNQNTSLKEAIEKETLLLDPIASKASIYLDTSSLNVHELQHLLAVRLSGDNQVTLLLESFGYKHGVPLDADFVFDVRCLPNPHWQSSLRELTGKQQEIKDFLNGHPEVEALYYDISQFLIKWLPRLSTDHRHYLTVAIGCTGGQHRSVYMVERLYESLKTILPHIQTLHRELVRRK
ncbi:MAG TPA: RNase adapter RapZ [Agitococcus sp.]|uniref:RNase adapter RapZ n=1 Tax=uncultured Agitococcus sp. TaxID=1506599 RepID=UPI002617EB38|nr:RNase adapter RapZ [uncultured Agitococcus sp.]HNA22140.1 RNase adapter RapZ [Agitococcus sp.]HNB19705.1 RNase adapter RapZ [Agitococcus sp.]HNE90783.1 RNase adapter RapZ [Agitococcus sp.]